MTARRIGTARIGPPNRVFSDRVAHLGEESLDPAWTRHGAASEYINHGVLITSFLNGSQGYFQPLTNLLSAGVTDYTVQTQLIIGAGGMCGPMVVDDSGNGVVGGFYEGSQFWVLGCSAYNYNSANQNISHTIPTPAWARLRVSGTNVYGSCGSDGVSWSSETPAYDLSSLTITRFGFGDIWTGTANLAVTDVSVTPA